MSVSRIPKPCYYMNSAEDADRMTRAQWFWNGRSDVSLEQWSQWIFRCSAMSKFLWNIELKRYSVDELIKYFETPTVNLYLELSVVIYFKELKVSSSSDISIVALYHQIFVLYSFSLNYNSRLAARGRRSFVSSDISIVAL